MYVWYHSLSKTVEILGTAIVMLDGIGMRVTGILMLWYTAKVKGAINCGCMTCDVNDGHFEFPAFICVEDVNYLVCVHKYSWVKLKKYWTLKKKLMQYKQILLDHVTRMKEARHLTLSLPIARWRHYDH